MKEGSRERTKNEIKGFGHMADKRQKGMIFLQVSKRMLLLPRWSRKSAVF